MSSMAINHVTTLVVFVRVSEKIPATATTCGAQSWKQFPALHSESAKWNTIQRFQASVCWYTSSSCNTCLEHFITALNRTTSRLGSTPLSSTSCFSCTNVMLAGITHSTDSESGHLQYSRMPLWRNYLLCYGAAIAYKMADEHFNEFLPLLLLSVFEINNVVTHHICADVFLLCYVVMVHAVK